MIFLGKTGSRALPTIIGCLAVQLCIGILYLWGVFKSPVVAHYNWTAEAATMVSSYMLFAFVIGNLLGGFLQDRTNPKLVAIIGCVLFCGGILITSFLTAGTISWLYLTYCVISGIGCGMAYGSILSCIQKWLPHKRGFASGLAVSAFGFSTVIFTPVSKWLLNTYSVPVTFRILSIVFFAVSMAACLFIKLPSEEYLAGIKMPVVRKITGRNRTVGETMKLIPFWGIFIFMFLVNTTWTLTVPLVKDLGMERGLSETMSLLTLSMTGVFSASGRLIMATISDKLGRRRSMYLIAAVTLICALCLIFADGPVYMIAVFFAVFAYGGASSVTPAMTTDLAGPKYSGTTYGILLLSVGGSSIVFNAISTSILKSNPVATFIMGACTAFVALIVMKIASHFITIMQKREAQEQAACGQSGEVISVAATDCRLQA